jgi:hypothetical protein
VFLIYVSFPAPISINDKKARFLADNYYLSTLKDLKAKNYHPAKGIINSGFNCERFNKRRSKYRILLGVFIITTEVINKARIIRGFSKPPVSALKIAEELNVEIRYYDHPDFLKSFSVKMNNKYIIAMPIMLHKYDENYHAARQLGHICLGHFDRPTVDTFEDDKLSDKEREHLNNKADIFANELLLPIEWLWKEWSRCKDIRKIAEVFNFPEKLAAKRVKQLGRPIEEQYVIL